MNLYSYFRSQPHWNVEKPFLSDLKTRKDYSYGDLDRLSGQMASQWVNRFGIQPGDRIAVQVEKSPQAFFLYLACLRVGAIYLPLNTAYQPNEVSYFLQDAKPKMFICDPRRAAIMQEMMREIGHLGDTRLETLDEAGNGSLIEGVEKESEDFATVESSDHDLASILYTSGTTGRSKGAMLSHLNLKTNAIALAQTWGFTEQDRLLHTLPLFHVHGLFISLHTSLVSGSSVVWLPKFEAKEVLQNLFAATVFMGVPTYYTRLLELPQFTDKSCCSIRLFISGSAPLRIETFEEFESKTGHRILERYGMTETGINTSNPLEGRRVPGTVGKALPGIEVRVKGDPGMIQIRGPNVFQGYWNQPDQSGQSAKTRAEFTDDGYFMTGDLGFIDGEGYLSINGRAKDLIISGGFNVYPKEVEVILDDLPGIKESAVIGVFHPDFGEGVIALVVPNDVRRDEAMDEMKVIAQVKKQLASFKVPKRVFFVNSLPRNTMGKVQKAQLRNQYEKTFFST